MKLLYIISLLLAALVQGAPVQFSSCETASLSSNSADEHATLSAGSFLLRAPRYISTSLSMRSTQGSIAGILPIFWSPNSRPGGDSQAPAINCPSAFETAAVAFLGYGIVLAMILMICAPLLSSTALAIRLVSRSFSLSSLRGQNMADVMEKYRRMEGRDVKNSLPFPVLHRSSDPSEPLQGSTTT